MVRNTQARPTSTRIGCSCLGLSPVIRIPRRTAQMDHRFGGFVELGERLGRQFRVAVSPADILGRLVLVEPGRQPVVIRIDQHELGALADRDTRSGPNFPRWCPRC